MGVPRCARGETGATAGIVLLVLLLLLCYYRYYCVCASKYYYYYTTRGWPDAGVDDGYSRVPAAPAYAGAYCDQSVSSIGGSASGVQRRLRWLPPAGLHRVLCGHRPAGGCAHLFHFSPPIQLGRGLHCVRSTRAGLAARVETSVPPIQPSCASGGLIRARRTDRRCGGTDRRASGCRDRDRWCGHVIDRDRRFVTRPMVHSFLLHWSHTTRCQYLWSVPTVVIRVVRVPCTLHVRCTSLVL